jgi:hypothetical protein
VVGVIVPQAGEHAAPSWVRVQLTPLLVPSFTTVALNCCVSFSATLAEVGDKDTEVGRIDSCALPNALLVTEVAWIVKLV